MQCPSCGGDCGNKLSRSGRFTGCQYQDYKVNTKTIISIELITDDNTGFDDAGGYDYSLPVWVKDWLDADHQRAESLAKYMEQLAVACRARKMPFDGWQQSKDIEVAIHGRQP